MEELKYQTPLRPSDAARTGELFTLKLRYKEPDGKTSRLISVPVVDEGHGLGSASEDFKFASAVALFGMLLRDSAYAGEATLDDVRRLSLGGIGRDAGGHRSEFHDLVGLAISAGD